MLDGNAENLHLCMVSRAISHDHSLNKRVRPNKGKILFPKTELPIEIPPHYSKNNCSGLACIKKEIQKTCLPTGILLQLYLATLSIWLLDTREMPRPCPIHSVQIIVSSNKRIKESEWRAAGKQRWQGGCMHNKRPHSEGLCCVLFWILHRPSLKRKRNHISS